MRILTIFLASLLVVACGEEQAPGADPFGNTTWLLVAATVDGDALVPITGRPVTFGVDNAQIAGNSACNWYGGPISIEDGAIAIGPTSMTEMACSEEGAMELEAAYLAALGRVTGFSREGDELVLTGDGVELRFTAQPAEADASLVGTTWTLETIIEAEAASTPAAAANLVFAEDGTVSGSTGCNNLFGNYSETEGFTQIATTKMACKEPIMGQEALVGQILGPDATITIEGSLLTIADLEGRALVYRATP